MQIIEHTDLLQTVFDAAPNGIAVMQSVYDDNGSVADFSILLFNTHLLNRIGGIDYKGKRYADIFPETKETGILDQFKKVAATGAPADFESWYSGEGMNYWFHFTAVKKGELLVVTSEDISKRKEVEIALTEALNNAEKQRRLYHSVTNNTPDLVYVFDLDYRFTYANKALLSMWGKTAEESIGKGLREIGYEEWHALMHEREIDEVVATGKRIRGTVSFLHAELGKRIYDYIFAPVFNELGEVEAVAGTTRDITDLKRTEESLKQSEARLKSVIDQTPAATLVLRGDDLVIEQINHTMLQFIGQGTEIIGKPLIGALPELEGQYVWQQVQKVYREGIPFDQSEVWVPHTRNGIIHDHYYNLAYRPIKEHGQITGMIQVAIDVTELVVARKKLEESDSRFRALVNATSDVVYRMNADWTEMRQLEGRGSINDTGEPVDEWISKYIDSRDHEKVSEAIDTAIASKSVFEIEHQTPGTDGTTEWTFLRAIPILDKDGNIVEWFGTASDITEKKKSENIIHESAQDLRNLVLQAPIGICVIDANTLICEIANDTYVEIAGKPYSSIIGKRHWETFPEAAPYYEAALQSVIDKAEAFYANQVALMLVRHGKEEIIYVTFVYEPMVDINGSVKKVVVWVMDNTLQVNERKKVEESEALYRILSETLEQQVSDRTKELQRSNEDLQQFAHVASHDLKEPVRKIKTFTDRLEKNLAGKLDPDGSRFIERIHIATNRMFNMIDGVLTYSTTNAGIQNCEMVNLNEIIKSIETDLEVALQTTGAKISSTGLPAIEGATVLLYQLFYNLVNNSIKFTVQGTAPQIDISAAPFSFNDQDMTRIIFRDNGIGFEQEFAERIFETFTRLNSKDDYEGTGLGLALCKKIVERHGGHITASGNPGQGALFTILLPIQQKQALI